VHKFGVLRYPYFSTPPGGWPVARFGIVLIDQRTADNSSIQHLPHLRSLSKVFVHKPRRTSAFALSAWPLLRGCATEAKRTLLPRSSMYCMKAWLVNCVPLSVMILLGTPKRQTSPLKNLMADYAVTFLTAYTSGHATLQHLPSLPGRCSVGVPQKRNRPCCRGLGCIA